MEQQDQVQSVEDPKVLECYEENVEYVFENGVYTCKGLKGAYMSVTSLRKAWVKMLKEKKLKEIKRALSEATRGEGKVRKKAVVIRERDKWLKV